MSREMERLGRTIRRAESKGPVRFVTGVTTSAAASGRISVMVAGAVVPAVIPGSFRAALAVGQDIRLSVQGSTYTVDSVLSALSTPTVAAPPSASGISPGVNGSGSSGCYDWDDGGSQLGNYAQDIAEVTRALAGDINELRGDVGDHASDISSLKTTVNTLRTTVADLKAALVAQGHVV